MNVFRVVGAALALFVVVGIPVRCDTVEITGQMSTAAKFQDIFYLDVPSGVQALKVTIPLPTSGQEFGYALNTGTVVVQTSRTADDVSITSDRFGNHYKVETFYNPQPGRIQIDLKMDAAIISTDINTPLPHCSISEINAPKDLAIYLKGTDKVESSNPEIAELAQALSVGSDDEATVAVSIQQWLQKSLTYNVLDGGVNDDAVHVLEHRSGLCDGWAHLFLALARANGIPARFVGGYNLGGQVTYPMDSAGRATITVMSSSQPHSWVELWFPTVGWVPFEPQASAGFIDTHHLKAWAGADSTSAVSFLSWSSSAFVDVNIPMSEEEQPAQMTDSIGVAYANSDPEPSLVTVLTRCRSAEVTSL
jgi:transglutaminase-like putative cysteine protease